MDEAFALVNTRLLAMEPVRPEGEAVLVEHGRITRVGTTRQVRRVAPGAREFDAAGRTLVPGFVDGQAYVEMTCLALTRTLSCPTPPYRSLAEIREALRLWLGETPPGRWVVGRTSFGLYAKITEDRRFTRHDLDVLSQEHPIAVLAGLHVAMAEHAGAPGPGPLGRGADAPRGPDPPGALGRADGVATEVWNLLPAFGLEETTEAIRAKAAERFLTNGVTSVHTIPVSAADVAADHALQRADQLPLRLYYHVPHQVSLDALLDLGLRPGFGNEMLQFGGVKIFVDEVGRRGADRIREPRP